MTLHLVPNRESLAPPFHILTSMSSLISSPTVLGACFFLCITCSYPVHAETAPVSVESITPFLKQYCIDCHGSKKSKGDLRLDQLSTSLSNERTAETWQEVLDALNMSEMPPEDEDQPPRAAMIAAIDHLTNRLYKAGKQLTDKTQATMRQLNRREYHNSIKSLLGVPVDISRLPNDNTFEGFDRVGSVQEMSAQLFNSYRAIGKQALDKAFSRALGKQGAETFLIQAETEHNKYISRQLKIRNKSLEAESRLISKGQENSRRLDRTAKKYVVSALYQTIPATKTGYVFVGDENGSPQEFSTPFPNDNIGTYHLTIRAALTHPSPDKPYIAQVSLIGEDGGSTPPKDIGIFKIENTSPETQTFEFELNRSTDTLDTIVIKVLEPSIKGGGHESHYLHTIKQAEAKLKTALEKGNKLPLPLYPQNSTPTGKTCFLWLDSINIVGPLKNPSSDQAFTFFTSKPPTQPEAESVYARKIIDKFTRHVFRGQAPADNYITALHQIYLSYREIGTTPEPARKAISPRDKKRIRMLTRKKRNNDTTTIDPEFIAALREALSVALSSPRFLLHAESSSDKNLSALDLAKRLSYFLWSAPPDTQLNKLANQNKLAEPRVLRSEVERMLAAPRASSFIDSFTTQWLGLDRLQMIVVHKGYKKFNEKIRTAFKEETLSFSRELIRENLSARNFIDSDFTMANGLLVDFYKLGEPHIDGFKRVAIPTDSPRGGLLGQGAILTLTSSGERTSPVLRGNFVLSRMLGSPPPPPPPNVPQLQFDGSPAMPIRERLRAHTQSAQCASCHQRFDPIGFALENFDTIGDWRDNTSVETMVLLRKVKGSRKNTDLAEINSRSELRGETLNGYEGVKQYLSSKEDVVTNHILRSMLIYALGRPLGFSDNQWVSELHKKWQVNDYRMRDLVQIIVSSQPFQSQ